LSTSVLTPTTISRSKEGVRLRHQTATSGDCGAEDTTSDRTLIEIIENKENDVQNNIHN